jgi:hypothetical protein
MTDDFALEIDGGRHPVVERMMPREQFIPERHAARGEARLIILTGPNMAGKSTILRQIGLDRADRPGGELRSRSACAHRDRGPRVHARRCERQSRARPIDVHGGDGGDERDSPHGNAAESRAARRDRARDVDVRWRIDRLGR